MTGSTLGRLVEAAVVGLRARAARPISTVGGSAARQLELGGSKASFDSSGCQSLVAKTNTASVDDLGEDRCDSPQVGGPSQRHRIATVFTLRNLKEDLEDVGSRFDGAPDLEFRLATEALELERSGLSYQRVPPGYRFPYGHTHRKQEEVYVVLHGSGRMKLDDKIVELREWDAVRVPPGTWRGYEAGPEGLEIIVIGAPNLGEAPREDVDGQRDWWAD